MKRYLKESLQRESSLSSPWLVKPRLARHFGLPTEEPEEVRQRNAQIRGGVIAKRKRVRFFQAERAFLMCCVRETTSKCQACASGVEVCVHFIRVDCLLSLVLASYVQNDAPLGSPEDEYAFLDAEDDLDPSYEKQPKTKTIKYPIEDLNLDPISVFDGRLLKKNSDLPALPPYPMLERTMPVSRELMPDFLQTWNILNVFG